MKNLYLLLLLLSPCLAYAQTGADDLADLMGAEKPAQELVYNAFKSTRVVNGHSMEMLGEGVLDFRIMHRFGSVQNGLSDMFGLDLARMRMSFDYGISKNLTVGVGRSTLGKELDGFVKYRVLHQQKGEKNIPVSVIWVSGMMVKTLAFTNPLYNTFSNRLSYYHQAIIGRKFSEQFALQLSPTYVHRNLVETRADYNTAVALGVGARLKLTGSTALLLDTYPMLYGNNNAVNKLPLSIGVDIETGGHVFQLHFSNAQGMNEKAFITETYQDWGKGEFQFGFNLSRVFTVKKNTASSF